MLAQHRDDQAETLLFRLMRGAGVRGLAGMPVSRALGDGHLLRPLLDVARQDLEAYAREQGLDWVEDPSNQDTRLDRNYLRQIVLPALVSRWPRALGGMVRSAAHLAEGEALLGELAAIDLAAARDTEAFPGWVCRPSPSIRCWRCPNHGSAMPCVTGSPPSRPCPTAITGRAGWPCVMPHRMPNRSGAWLVANCAAPVAGSGGSATPGWMACRRRSPGRTPSIPWPGRQWRGVDRRAGTGRSLAGALSPRRGGHAARRTGAP